jgi:glucokinase
MPPATSISQWSQPPDPFWTVASRTPGLPWSIDPDAIRASLGLDSVVLLNDLETTCTAIPLLTPEDLVTIQEGRPRDDGTISVIAPGTGLGEAFMVWSDDQYIARPSEGGHAAFAPRSDLEVSLLHELHDRLAYVSYESVCSGAALPTLYRLLVGYHDTVEPGWLSELLDAAADQTPVIVDAALAARPGSEMCRSAVDLFVSILGSKAGDSALTVLATGGVYLGGGVLPRIRSILRADVLLRSFSDRGPDHGFLSRVPIHVITEPGAALMGAAWRGIQARISQSEPPRADRRLAAGGVRW